MFQKSNLHTGNHYNLNMRIKEKSHRKRNAVQANLESANLKLSNSELIKEISLIQQQINFLINMQNLQVAIAAMAPDLPQLNHEDVVAVIPQPKNPKKFPKKQY